MFETKNWKENTRLIDWLIEFSDGYFVDVPEPRLEILNSSKCYMSQCPQGCDEDTGQCICKKGYRLDAQNKCQGQ